MTRPATPSTRRIALALCASMVTAAALATVARPKAAPSTDLPPIDLAALFPRQFTGWQEDEASRSFVRPPELQGKVYGLYDQVLERVYTDAGGRRMMLSVAYGGDQSTSFQLHRPEACYEAAGFDVSDVHADALTLSGRRVAVTRVRASKPDRPEPITYWTVLGGEAVSGREGFRLKRVLAGLHGRTLTGLLVRISSIDTDTAGAYAAQARFADAMLRAMEPPARQTVLGTDL